MPFKMNYRDIPPSDVIQSECEGLAHELRTEFPETTRVEVTIARDRDQYEAHVHVTGRDIDLFGRAKNRESVAVAAREAFHRAHAQLRKHHDKLIFKPRRAGSKKKP